MINNNMIKHASNPRGYALKRWLIQLIADKYPTHDSIVERVGMALVTESDLKDFGKLLGTVYEAGYMKAINDYKSQVEKLGINIHIVPEGHEKSGETSDGIAEHM